VNGADGVRPTYQSAGIATPSHGQQIWGTLAYLARGPNRAAERPVGPLGGDLAGHRDRDDRSRQAIGALAPIYASRCVWRWRAAMVAVWLATTPGRHGSDGTPSAGSSSAPTLSDAVPPSPTAAAVTPTGTADPPKVHVGDRLTIRPNGIADPGCAAGTVW